MMSSRLLVAAPRRTTLLLVLQSNVRSLRTNAKKIHSSAKQPQSSMINLVHSNITTTMVEPPTYAQLKTLFVASAIPMVAFGFMDNLIMIQAGGYIDATFGATLGLATLSAAAMGQVVSDVSGVVFGSTVERLLQKYKIVGSPCLTNAQRKLPFVRNVTMAGMVVGITVGCLLGASSLLFVDLHAHERQKRTSQLKDVIRAMVKNDDETSVACQECHVHLSSVGKTFEYDATAGPQIRRLSDGPASKCLQDQVTLLDDKRLYVPIVAGNNALGVLEFVASDQEFSPEDKRTARIMARHVAIFMERLADSD